MKPNIYRIARDKAKLTREVAAELLEVSSSSLQDYENFGFGEKRTKPSDELVLRMMEVYNDFWLGYRHLRTSPLGELLLPEIECGDIGLNTLKFLKEHKDVADLKEEMIDIVSDGVIDEDELPIWNNCEKEIKELIGASIGVLHIKKRPTGATTGLFY